MKNMLKKFRGKWHADLYERLDSIERVNTIASCPQCESKTSAFQPQIPKGFNEVWNTKVIYSSPQWLDYYSTKHNFKTYQKFFYESIAKYIDFKGKTVLEIGGSDTPREIIFKELGVVKWVCINKPGEGYIKKRSKHYADLKQCKIGDKALDDAMAEDDYMLFHNYTDDMTNEFHGKFDVVLTCACFEHVYNVRDALVRLHECLVPGGVCYGLIGCIYSSAFGTHFIVDNKLRFDKARKFPIDISFAHLLMSYDDLYRCLIPYFNSNYEAEKAAFEIKNGKEQHLNRYFYEDYVDAFKSSPFSTINYRAWTTSPVNFGKLARLRQQYPGKARFDINDIEFFFKKE